MVIYGFREGKSRVGTASLMKPDGECVCCCWGCYACCVWNGSEIQYSLRPALKGGDGEESQHSHQHVIKVEVAVLPHPLSHHGVVHVPILKHDECAPTRHRIGARQSGAKTKKDNITMWCTIHHITLHYCITVKTQYMYVCRCVCLYNRQHKVSTCICNNVLQFNILSCGKGVKWHGLSLRHSLALFWCMLSLISAPEESTLEKQQGIHTYFHFKVTQSWFRSLPQQSLNCLEVIYRAHSNFTQLKLIKRQKLSLWSVP